MRFSFTAKPTPPVCVCGDGGGGGLAQAFSLMSKNKVLRLMLLCKYGLVHKPIVTAAVGSHYIKQRFV